MSNKKGFIYHPITWIVVAFIIGLVVMFLMAKGIIPSFGLGVC
ncbi:MAG: hypothetical protein QF632_02670 [Candidatus Woesearchaeota archaeon]|nr:hypothetical protein [Candidatus Woesearchaeota archaeon]